MSLHRRAAKRDANEAQIVEALRQIGCKVLYNEHPDLIVQYRGVIKLLECKTKTGRLTDSQKKLLDEGWDLHIVRSVTDALRAVTEDKRSRALDELTRQSQ